MMEITTSNLSTLPISPHLLWEYDLATFDFERSQSIVIERVIERGNLQDWRTIYAAYGKKAILATAVDSKQLSERDKAFTKLFITPKIHNVFHTQLHAQHPAA
ncbi:MAG: hypothetical protein AAF798_00985 [Bacteroidota bacterium]